MRQTTSLHDNEDCRCIPSCPWMQFYRPRRLSISKDAEALGREVLQGYQRTLPRPHEITLKSGYVLAGVLRENGKYGEAVAISEEVAEGRGRRNVLRESWEIVRLPGVRQLSLFFFFYFYFSPCFHFHV